MPNRIIREGILTSARIAKLGWPEEVFYRRLHSVVDDFGRYYADHGLLRAACYPRQLTKVSDSDIGKWLTVCVNAALVRVYPAKDGESYLEVFDFGQQVRAKKSKFPDPLITCAADAKQVQSDAHLDVSVSGVVSEGVVEGSAEPQSDSPPAIVLIPLVDKTEYGVTQAEVDEWSQAYPGVNVTQQLREMRAWSLANVANRKTRRGINAFVVRWLAKEQDKAGNTRPPFAQQSADVRSTTVPAKLGRDPALVRLEEDAAKAKPMTPEIRQALLEAAGRMRA